MDFPAVRILCKSSHMTNSTLRFFFAYGAGGCLWAGDTTTREKLGVGPVDASFRDLQGREIVGPKLLISVPARDLRDQIDFEHSAYLNPLYQPDPSLWTQALCECFNAKVDTLIALLRHELGARYDILDQQPRYSEDPRLAAYLLLHPDLSPVNTVTPPFDR
ncbi:hypothetical protein JJJ17_12490 [Paracoccus caeni]|uniref:Uncharacterized protein n=1 Tax=Paracoccus caeni TaxID=657651 RepID=A0A934SF59_9RHOB|nr:hypothetical protein [Paracoccus caeni]MBK4216747.1 hypothetical protein [Paracoccus caeni]